MPHTKSIRLATLAIFSIAFCAIPAGVNAQKTYQCGSNFSQTPCAGGVERDVKDSRSEEQKKQSEKSAVTAAKTADTMEKSRQTQERQDVAGNRGVVINAQPTPPDSPPPASTALKKKKRQAAEHFTAQAPGEKKDKKKAKAKKAKDTPA
jgi:hypothetical protein